MKKTLVSFGAGRSTILPAIVRSAYRNWNAPSNRYINYRFPPLQDLPLIHFTSLPLPPFDYQMNM